MVEMAWEAFRELTKLGPTAFSTDAGQSDASHLFCMRILDAIELVRIEAILRGAANLLSRPYPASQVLLAH